MTSLCHETESRLEARPLSAQSQRLRARSAEALTPALLLLPLQNRVLEVAVHSAGLQSQQKKLCWEELDQLVKQEQQLLRQENERLQREVQSAKSELAHAREKVNPGFLSEAS